MMLANLLSPTLIMAVLAGLLCCLPLIDWGRKRLGEARCRRLVPYGRILMLAVFFWDVLQLAASSFHPFIYFQF